MSHSCVFLDFVDSMNTFDAVRKIFGNQKGSCGLLLKIFAFQKMVHPTIHHRTIGGA